MSSPYISRLRQAISKASAAEDQLVLRAELAGALARYGDFDTAHAEVKSLREANTRFAANVAAWVLLAEGIISHFESLTPAALSSFRRSHAIAVSAGRSDIAAISGAWMAASEFLSGAVTAAAKHATHSILESAPDSFASLSRAHLVLADCLSCSGQVPQAQQHYSLARRFASSIGDISMQSVVLFNSSAFRVSRLSFADSIRRTPPPEEVVQVKLEVESISNLDSGLGLSSLSALVPLLSAQVSVVSKRWTDAISLYESTLPEAIAQGQDRWLAKFYAELAACYAAVDRTDDAKGAIAQSLETMGDCSDIDDRAIAHARLSTALEAIGLRERSLEHEAAMQTHRSSFETVQRKLQEELRPLLQQLPM